MDKLFVPGDEIDQHCLEAQDLCIQYPRAHTPLISNLSFRIEGGKLLSILGPNGCGKSTLLRTITGLIAPASGCVLLDDKPLSHYRASQRAQRMAYVPQMGAAVYDYTVEEYLVMGYASTLGMLRRPSARERQGVRDILAYTGLEPLAQKSILCLSGGERQMVSIARALLQRASLLVLDEPTSALDLGNQMRVLEMIDRLNTAGYTVIMTTHSPDHALLLQGDVLLIDKAGDYRLGSAQEVVTSEHLTKVYQTELVIERASVANRQICVAKRLKPEESWAFTVSDRSGTQ